MVLNWNRAEETLRCARSVLEDDAPAVVLLVVDNASTDGSYEWIRGALPDIELIRAPSNLGYAGGNNLAIRRALNLGAEYVLVLNNDTLVSRGSIDRLRATMEADDQIAQVGPLVIDATEDRVGSCGAEVRWRNAEPRLTGHMEKERGQFAGIMETGYVPGSAVLVRTAAIRDAGVLPEHYFLYFEDVAWSLQFQKKGWKTVIDPAARVYHWESTSTGKDSPLKMYYYVRNNSYFINEWVPTQNRLLAHALFRYKLVKLSIKRLLRGEMRHLNAVWHGYLDFRRGRQGKAGRAF